MIVIVIVKAEKLMSWLDKHSNLTWEEDGTVKVYGKPLPGSNIIDLVNEAVRQRKHSEPEGWRTFAQTLKESNVPRDYVGNKKRREWMHERDEEEVFGTSRMNIASRIKESAKRKQQPWLSYEEQLKTCFTILRVVRDMREFRLCIERLKRDINASNSMT